MTNPTPPAALTPPQTREYWYRVCLSGMFSSMPTYNAIRVVDHCIKNLDRTLPTLPLPERLRLATIHHIRTIAFDDMAERVVDGWSFPVLLAWIFRAQTHQGKWKEWGASTEGWDVEFTEGAVFYMNIAMGKMGLGGVSELVGSVWVPVGPDYWEKTMQPQLLVEAAVQIPGAVQSFEGETNV